MGNFNLRKLDLNLLTILEQLLTYRHVSQAASALNMSQPAVSRALSRLRDQFDDPLLVKTFDGYKLTKRAVLIHNQLQQVLTGIRDMMQLEEFDPARFKGEFKIAALDYEMFVIIPKLMIRLQESAPGISIQVMQYDPHVGLLKTLNNNIDIILYSTDDAPEGIFKQKLFSDNYAITMSKKHPLAKKDITLKEYCKLKHAIVSGDGIKSTDIDKALKQVRCKREVILSVPHFSLSPKIVANSELVMTMPSKLIKYIGGNKEILLKNLPFKMEDFHIEQFWYELQHYNPAHQWLRKQVKDIVKGI